MKKWFKSYMVIVGVIMILTNSGCSYAVEEIALEEIESEVRVPVYDKQEEIKEITEIYCSAYENVELITGVNVMDLISNIVQLYGQNGYVAIDSKNRINMTEPDQVIRFCEAVKEKVQDEVIIVEITYYGGIVIYELQTTDGDVNVIRSYYKYENGNMQKMVVGNYEADYFEYTEDGYLMFSGSWFSEDLYVLTLSGVEEHTAFRVQPLDEIYRELNRTYLQPISYEQNNMFLVDWSEENFGSLDFYDLYDICYELINGRSVPYLPDDNLGVGAVYRIPAKDFESVIQTYFDIDCETLRSKTTYYAEDDTYEYKPRGFYEVEYPEYPYSEVVDFTENADGTIMLMANVVFPYAGISKVYTHEVVVRPLENGGVQYVSNHILQSEENYEMTWHTPRLTQDEWEEVYGGE